MAPTFRGRLALTLGLTALLSVALTALIAFGLVRRFAEEETRRGLAERANAVAAEAPRIDARGFRRMRQVLRASGDFVAIVSPAGIVQGHDPEMEELVVAVDLVPVFDGSRLEGSVTVDSGTFAYVALPAQGPLGVRAAILLARPVELVRAVWVPVVRRTVLAGGLAVLLAVLASYLVARRLTGPIRRVADATGKVAEGDLDHRVPVQGDDEVAHLAQSFNQMASSLSEARRREREFLASVSHELKTPLTSIRGYAEAIAEKTASGEDADRAVEVISSEADRLERLVTDVMDLARMGAGDLRLEPSEVDLSETIDEAARAHARVASDAGVLMDTHTDGDLFLVTDAGRVRQVISNLVENAMRVTPSGGRVVVGARREDSHVVVEVTDTGPGISADDLPHVFERSYLWAHSRGVREVGTGLGLAIVRELAEALGGRLDVESQVGEGSTFRLRLPD